MKTKCSRCNTNCVGCAGWHCKCGMKTSQVQVYNNFILDHQLNKEQDDKLVELLKEGLPQFIIKGIIIDWKTEEEILEIRKEFKQAKIDNKSAELAQFGVCVYPIWSARLWQWAECIYCGQAKFYNKGQECPSLNNNTTEWIKTVDVDE